MAQLHPVTVLQQGTHFNTALTGDSQKQYVSQFTKRLAEDGVSTVLQLLGHIGNPPPDAECLKEILPHLSARYQVRLSDEEDAWNSSHRTPRSALVSFYKALHEHYAVN